MTPCSGLKNKPRKKAAKKQTPAVGVQLTTLRQYNPENATGAVRTSNSMQTELSAIKKTNQL
jgi:hypothetical protein